MPEHTGYYSIAKIRYNTKIKGSIQLRVGLFTILYRDQCVSTRIDPVTKTTMQNMKIIGVFISRTHEHYIMTVSHCNWLNKKSYPI